MSGIHRLSGLVLLIVGFCLTVVHAHAIDIKQVKTPGGITAWLVEDYTLPIIAFSYAFEGGSSQDDEGKEGTVRILSALLDEGAGDMDSSQFRARLEENGIEMGFSSSRDRMRGVMRTVREDRELAFSMLQTALTQPRFDQEAIDRMRDAITTFIVRSKTNPSSVGSKAVREALFSDHPYGKSTSGTEESIASISRDDIVAMHKNLFARDQLTIGVVGAISEAELSELLDKTFGALPEKSKLKDIADIKPALGDDIAIEMPVPNASITMVYQGLKRDDPDFFAAHLMNHILGGGSFSSRLYEELREKRGLTYGVSSGIVTSKHSTYLIASNSTRAENRKESVALMRSEFERMAEKGVTQEELNTAKKYVAGSYAINNLDTSGKIAGVLVGLQTQKLGKDYISNRIKQIEAVTIEDVNRMAKKLLSVEPSVVVVGPPAS